MKPRRSRGFFYSLYFCKMIRSGCILFCCVLLFLGASAELHAQKNPKGIISLTDDAGNVSSGKMKKGKKTGEWRTVDKQGHLLRSEQYLHGELNGITIEFTNTGDTGNLYTYRNGTLNGLSYHFLRPDKREEGYYVNGKKENWWVTHSRGSYPKVDSFYYVNGVLQGAHKFYDGGKLQEIEYYRDGMKHGGDTAFNYDTSGILLTGYWRYGKRDSLYREYALSGEVLKQMMYRSDTILYDSVWSMLDDKRVLVRATQYNDAGIMTYSECYRCGLINSSGLTSMKFYYGPDGLIDSLYEYYAGTLLSINYYDQQQPTDLLRTYHYQQKRFDSKGRLEIYGAMNQSLLMDKWTWLDSTGRVTKEIEYSAPNAPHRYTVYYPNGKVKITGVCESGWMYDSIRVYSNTGKEIKAGTAQYKQMLASQFATETLVHYQDPEMVPENAGEKP